MRKIQYTAALGLCILTVLTGNGTGVLRAHAAVIISAEAGTNNLSENKPQSDAETSAGDEQSAVEEVLEAAEAAEAPEPESLGFFILDEVKKAEEAVEQEERIAAKSVGQQVADYAVQFIGNPYRYGGSSLTNGADCSGFVMSVFRKFGVSLPHSSSALAGVGRSVGTSLSNAVPGDLICYSGHVGIYIGGGKIVHASSERTGIKISNASYKSIRSIRRVI